MVWNSPLSASKVRSLPVSSSPMPQTYLMASSASRQPITPAMAPITPACLQVGTASLGGMVLKTQR